MSVLRFKEVDLLIDFLTSSCSYFNTIYEWTDKVVDEKEVSKMKFITPGNDEVIISFFEDRSNFLKIEVNQKSLTFINRKFIPIERKIEYDCKGKIVDFELDMESEGYKEGYIKIYKLETDKIPEMNIKFDYFFYYEV